MKTTTSQLSLAFVAALAAMEMVAAAGPLPTPAAARPDMQRRQLDPFVLSSVLANSAANADLSSYYDAVGKLLTDSSALSDYEAMTTSIESSVVSDFAAQHGGSSSLASSLASSVFAGIVSDASSRQAAGTATTTSGSGASSTSQSSSGQTSTSSSSNSNGASALPFGSVALTSASLVAAVAFYLF
ncbi:hypothetical protein FA10DRAFT_259471 [Acaromyces ingoldii]|uniref:Uncharacterized protein n=1 Tax=Acaromyces ingoldii TaxID=215250 RepID=A0A316YWS5_9BASI|nr:hypothetical protein FA10DRAFT_259471 [Acaromyces ingoldii]PWN92245.1 hypothetical protein FA10DRAFT_259471 [Acaromyces ingoldii]